MPSSTITPLERHSEPAPLGKLLTYPVVIATSNYVALSFINAVSISLLPLFMAMPIELGGLGFTPMTIGYVLGAVNACSGLFSIFFLARLIRKFGERRLFIVGMLASSAIFIMLPLVNMVARRAGVTWVVWCLAFSLSLLPVKDMCYGESESKAGSAVLTERQAAYSFSLRHHPRTNIRLALRMASCKQQHRSRWSLGLLWQHHSSRSLWREIFSEVTQYIPYSFHCLALHYFLLGSFQLSHGTRMIIDRNETYVPYECVDRLDPLVSRVLTYMNESCH